MRGSDARVTLVKSGSISAVCCSTLKDYNCAANQIRILPIADCEMHGQSVYATCKSGASRKMLTSVVVVENKSDE